MGNSTNRSRCCIAMTTLNIFILSATRGQQQYKGTHCCVSMDTCPHDLLPPTTTSNICWLCGILAAGKVESVSEGTQTGQSGWLPVHTVMSSQSTGDNPIEQYIDALHSRHSTKFPLVRMRNTLRPHGIIGDKWRLDNICQCCNPSYQRQVFS